MSHWNILIPGGYCVASSGSITIPAELPSTRHRKQRRSFRRTGVLDISISDEHLSFVPIPIYDDHAYTFGQTRTAGIEAIYDVYSIQWLKLY